MENRIKFTNIHEIVNANRHNKLNFSKVYRGTEKSLHTWIKCIEARQLQKEENKCLFGNAMLKHNTLSRDDKRNKAYVLCINALMKGRLPFGTSRAQIKDAINGFTSDELASCENKTGYNLDKLLLKVSRTIAKSKKSNNKPAKKSAKKSNK